MTNMRHLDGCQEDWGDAGIGKQASRYACLAKANSHPLLCKERLIKSAQRRWLWGLQGSRHIDAPSIICTRDALQCHYTNFYIQCPAQRRSHQVPWARWVHEKTRHWSGFGVSTTCRMWLAHMPLFASLL